MKKKGLLSAGEVAAIWNRRAREMGYKNPKYSRFHVRKRRESGALPYVDSDVTGYYFTKEAAESIELYPRGERDEEPPALAG